MKKNPFKFLVIAVLATFVAFTACQDYDDDITRLDKELAAVKTDLQGKIDNAKSELQTAINNAIATVNSKIAALEDDLAKAATKAELQAVKDDLAANYLKKTVFETYKADALQALNAAVARITALETNSATKAELTEAKNALQTQLNTLKGDLEDLTAAAATKVELNTAVAALQAKIAETDSTLLAITDALDGRVTTLEDSSATKAELLEVKLELEGTIATIQTALDTLRIDHDNLASAFGDLKGAYDTFIGEFDGTVADILTQITTEVAELKGQLEPRIVTLETVLGLDDDGNSAVLADIYEKIQENTDSIDALRIDMLAKYAELVGEDLRLDSLIKVNADNIATNAGNIETNRQAIKAINDYITDTLEPRLDDIEGDIDALEGRMLAAEKAIGLNIVNINILSQQVKSLTFIPTRGFDSGCRENTIKLYYNAGDYSADHVLMYRVSPASAVVGRDFVVESLNYQITTRFASDDANDVNVYLNGDAYMHEDFPGVLCVPVHVVGDDCDVQPFEKEEEALTLVLTVKNIGLKADADEDDDFNVYVSSTEMVNTEFVHTPITLHETAESERELNAGLAAAKNFANEAESGDYEPGERRWNAMLFNMGAINLYSCVQSFFDVEGNDCLYDDLGSFGRPYTDKPVYAAPVYEFEIVAEWKGAAPHWIDPQDRYTEIVDGSILKVKAGKENSSINKKVIVKVTQVNSAIEKCQVVAYLVVKITDDPAEAWEDIRYTFDFTNIPYFHGDADGEVNPKDGTYGVNPGDVDALINLFPTGSMDKEKFWNSSYVTHWPANHQYVPGTGKFTPFEYNKVDPNPGAGEAFKWIEIDRNYSINSFVVKVKKEAPAGKYEATYKLRYTLGTPAVQAGPDLYITFKFQVGVRQMTVQKDEPMWHGNTLHVQYARMNNTNDLLFLDNTGYKVNLTESFKHDTGTKKVTITTNNKKDHGGADIATQTKNPPVYSPKFEFIKQKAITDAGFKYKADEFGYVTQIMKGDLIAAEIKMDGIPGQWDMIRLYIMYNEAGDALYNWIHGIDKSKVLAAPYNDVQAEPKLIKVRMLTDVNECGLKLNKFYLHEFDVLFERALHTKFTTVELDDRVNLHTRNFNFLTRWQNPETEEWVKRGLFDNDDRLVSSKEAAWNGSNHGACAEWFGVETLATLPTFVEAGNERDGHVDYEFVEYSDDGVTWKAILQDLRADTHGTRYFDIIWQGQEDNKTWQAVFQGDQTISTKPIYFRVPIVNVNELGVAGVAFRHGEAYVQGYAVFKINPRNPQQAD